VSEARPSRRQAQVLKAWTRFHRWAYQRTNGKVLSRMRGKPMLLLTTTGRRTGRLHTLPLPYLADGDTMIVIGSNSGAERHPAWVLNLIANPCVTVQYLADSGPAQAEILADGERTAMCTQPAAGRVRVGGATTRRRRSGQSARSCMRAAWAPAMSEESPWIAGATAVRPDAGTRSAHLPSVPLSMSAATAVDALMTRVAGTDAQGHPRCRYGPVRRPRGGPSSGERAVGSGDRAVGLGRVSAEARSWRVVLPDDPGSQFSP
jgi:deazaflavin-dependent oxidoreductase (nitroreductase family)